MGDCVFWALPISPIGRIGLISPILNALWVGIVFNTRGYGGGNWLLAVSHWPLAFLDRSEEIGDETNETNETNKTNGRLCFWWRYPLVV